MAIVPGISALIDSEAAIPGFTSGPLLSGLAAIGVPSGKNYNVIGWGHGQVGRTGSTIVMPRPGKIISRPWTAQERDALIAIGKRNDIEIETVPSQDWLKFEGGVISSL